MKTPLLIILLISILQLSHADQSLIDSTCRNTTDYQLCVSSLRADKRSATADAQGLAHIMVDTVGTKTEDALSAFKSLRAQGKLSTALQQCEAGYMAVLQSVIPRAKQALKAGNAKDAENGMATVAAHADACQDAAGKANVLGVAVRAVAGVARRVIRSVL